MRIVHAGVDAGKERAVSEETPGAFLQRMDTGDASAGEIGEGQAFWFFHVGDLREVCDVVHQLFRKKQDGVLKEKIGDAGRRFLPEKKYLPDSATITSQVPVEKSYPVPREEEAARSASVASRGKIQKIFAFLIVSCLNRSYLILDFT